MSTDHSHPLTSPAPPLLTLCMIVRNECAHLARCLASVQGIVDEIVVVDTGSTDGTQAIARAYGARVIQTTWAGDFSQARNHSLAVARGRWILVLDADETLPATEHSKLRSLVMKHTPANGSPNRAFGLLQKSTSDGGLTGMLVNIIRLFPNRAEVRYHWPVHEQVATSLARAQIPIEATTITMLHTGYVDSSRNREKQLRNRAILASQIAAGVDVTPLTLFLFAGCHLDLGDTLAALQSYQIAHQRALSCHDTEIATGAAVRIANCLVKLERFLEVAASAHEMGDDPHPEILNLCALAEEKLDRPEAARGLRERVLSCADRPRIPACNVATEKIAALKALGAYWFGQGHKARAVSLLRGAVTLQQGTGEFGPTELARSYGENC